MFGVKTRTPVESTYASLVEPIILVVATIPFMPSDTGDGNPLTEYGVFEFSAVFVVILTFKIIVLPKTTYPPPVTLPQDTVNPDDITVLLFKLLFTLSCY